MDIACLIYSDGESSISRCIGYLDNGNNINTHLSTNVDDLLLLLSSETCSGIVIDIKAIIKSSDTEKRKLKSLFDVYPHIRMSCPGGIPVQSVFAGEIGSTEGHFGYFIDSCRRFEARRLRRHDRHPMHINTQLHIDNLIYRSFTMDLSYSGCFMVYCDKVENNKKINVEFIGLESELFEMEIVWVSNWEEGGRIPGFGARFNHLTDEQKELIDALLI